MMVSCTDWETRKPHHRASGGADQVEFSAISHGSSNLEAGLKDDRIADALDDLEVVDPLDVPDWAEADSQYDTATGSIGDEIQRRLGILGSSYPFQVRGNTIAYKQSRTLAYEFCLAVSQSPSLSQGEFKRLPQAFERLSRDVIRCYIGRGSEGYRTGWPKDKFEPRPTRFRDVVNELHKRTGEWHWCPGPRLPPNPGHQHLKDAGIDFVVWKPMPDGRKGQLFLLGQCACGDDWTEKFYDIDLNKLKENWIRPLSAATPLRVFATPRHLPNDTEFAEINASAGLTIDRARIAVLAEHRDNRRFVTEQMKDPYAELIKLVIPDFEVCSRARAPRRQTAAGARRSRSRGSGA